MGYYNVFIYVRNIIHLTGNKVTQVIYRSKDHLRLERKSPLPYTFKLLYVWDRNSVDLIHPTSRLHLFQLTVDKQLNLLKSIIIFIDGQKMGEQYTDRVRIKIKWDYGWDTLSMIKVGINFIFITEFSNSLNKFMLVNFSWYWSWI